MSKQSMITDDNLHCAVTHLTSDKKGGKMAAEPIYRVGKGPLGALNSA